MALLLRVQPLDLQLAHPFTITRGTEEVAHTALIRVLWNQLEGLGESAPIARYGESAASVIAYFREHPPNAQSPYLLETILHGGIPPAARAGLDIALHDLIGKDCGRPLYELLGLDPSRTPVTSFTIGIASPEETLAKVAEIGEHPVLKVKLGTGTDDEQISIVELIRSRYGGAIRVDANEGWDAERAVHILRELQRFEIEFCEQPIPAGHPEQLRYIKERVAIPIVTDEDSLCARDLPRLRDCVDGVNVKLAKCGGIREALAMIHTARALGFRVMLGCMVESQIAASAAAHISPLVDWADIDGPFLAPDERFSGITYDRGKIVLSDKPGLGVLERVALA